MKVKNKLTHPLLQSPLIWRRLTSLMQNIQITHQQLIFMIVM